ncbi:MAG: flagellar motor switch protein FliM [Chloroflexi bacterium]|nr:flagellar motor switch protein FliM [Chloroflexota bacterium]
MSTDEDKILSQKEIDALLSILPEDGGALSSEGAVPSTSKVPANVKLYDFRSPNKFSKEQIRTLKMMHESFARRLTSGLSAYLRSAVQATFVYVEQGTYEQLTNHVPDPSIIYVVKMSPLPGRIFISVDASLASVFVDRLLGGSGRGVPETHTITDIEIGLVQNVAKRTLDALTDAWSNVVDLQPLVEESTQNVQFVQIALSSDAAVFIALEVRVQEAIGTMSLCIPFQVIKPIMFKLSPHAWVAGQEKSEPETDFQEIRQQVSYIPVNVVAQLGTVDLTVRELMSLRPGDVIPLNSHIDSELPLLTEGEKMGSCRPGTLGGQLAVVITDALTSSSSLATGTIDHAN